jgi:hypothetical protein
MDDMAIERIEPAQTIALRQSGFEEWCNCVRRLLGWSQGMLEEWPALFATGHTPRDAARAAVYGESLGD